MKKFIFTFLWVICTMSLPAQIVPIKQGPSTNSQPNNQSYEDKYFPVINQKISEGNCQRARELYNVYKEMSGHENSEIERRIANCSSKASFSIGDTIYYKDCLNDSPTPYVVAYLDDTKLHGFAIRYDGLSNNKPWDGPSIKELQMMYKNRYVLGLSNKECWSSTHEEGSDNCHTGFFAALNGDYCKYYTFDYSSGKTHKRKIRDRSFFYYRVIRF